jgi:very-short-patch-repair endonuclease
MHDRIFANPRYKDTSIEKMFMEYCDDHNISYCKQFQIEKGTHKYDFKINETNILVETDGEYWHSSIDQRNKDVSFQEYAASHGYVVIRFTDTEIHDSAGECFNKIFDLHLEDLVIK